jgi:ribonuclease HII
MNSNAFGIKLWNNRDKLEVGLDECARGCLLGRTYMAAVIWSPEFLEESIQESEFNWLNKIRDSKKLSSKTRELLAEYIKEYCLDYSIQWADEKEIDKKNILQAVQDGFHKCLNNLQMVPDTIYVDGNYFKTYCDRNLNIISHQCIEQGDNKYLSIASASILAKVEHDKYISELCANYPILSENYGISSNMGYGTKTHLDGIKKHGITKFHRKTFGCCGEASLLNIDEL